MTRQTAAQLEAAAIETRNAEFFAMRATGWQLTDGSDGPFWWRTGADGKRETRTRYLTMVEKIDWLQNRPEHEHEPRVLVVFVHQREPKRATHVPPIVARLNIHDGAWIAEAPSYDSLDDALAKLIALVADYEAARRR